MIDTDVRQGYRRKMRVARARITPAMRMQAAIQLLEQLEAVPNFHTANQVAVYWAVGGELPLVQVVDRLLERGQCVLLPVIQPDGSLRFSPWQRGGDVRVNRFGIPEPYAPDDAVLNPANLELVLLPLLAFDRIGNRLGSGAGYYDRSFAFLKSQTHSSSKPLLIGVAYAMQEVDSLPSAPWDVALDAIVTEQELIPVSMVQFSA